METRDEKVYEHGGKRYRKGEKVNGNPCPYNRLLIYDHTNGNGIAEHAARTPNNGACWLAVEVSEVAAAGKTGIKIELGKAYRTRSGQKAVVLSSNSLGNFAASHEHDGLDDVLGNILKANGHIWHKPDGAVDRCGKDLSPLAYDLVAPWPEAPEGFALTDEFREPVPGENYLDVNGVTRFTRTDFSILCGEGKYADGRKRHILRKLDMPHLSVAESIWREQDKKPGAGAVVKQAHTPEHVDKARMASTLPAATASCDAVEAVMTHEDCEGMCKGPDELFYHMEEARLELLMADMVREKRAIACRLARIALLDELDAESRPKVGRK